MSATIAQTAEKTVNILYWDLSSEVKMGIDSADSPGAKLICQQSRLFTIQSMWCIFKRKLKGSLKQTEKSENILLFPTEPILQRH